MSRLPSRAIQALSCPVCAQALAGQLSATSQALRCGRGHSFDIARQGYVNLLPASSPHGSTATADSAAMVQARAEFLAAGHYDPLARRLAATARDLIDSSAENCAGGVPDETTAMDAEPLIVDAGAGTGDHLASMMEAVPRAVGLASDVSKYAARRAARAHDRIGAVVCDIWHALPIRSGVVDLVVNVFAPRHAAEFHRVLRGDGRLVVVTPTERHLTELVDTLDLVSVDTSKADRLERTLSETFHPDRGEVVEYPLELSPAEVEQLVTMGPSGRHVDTGALREMLDRRAAPVQTTASFRIVTYRPVS